MHAHLSDLTLAKLSGVFAALSGVSGVFFAITDAVAISAITSAGAVIMAGISAYYAYKAKTIAEGTHKAVNSRLTELLELTRNANYDKGVKDQSEKQQKEQQKEP